MKTINFQLNRTTKLSKKIVSDAPSRGPFDSYAEYLLNTYNIKVSLQDSIAYLKTLGAWEDTELQNLETNKSRILWLACLDCQENNTSYWYMGE